MSRTVFAYAILGVRTSRVSSGVTVSVRPSVSCGVFGLSARGLVPGPVVGAFRGRCFALCGADLGRELCVLETSAPSRGGVRLATLVIQLGGPDGCVVWGQESRVCSVSTQP